MIFSSYEFIFLFLPFVWGIYFLLHKKNHNVGAKCFLVLASFVFYGIGSPEFVYIFMASVALNYCIGNKLAKCKQSENITAFCKILFAFGILFNVALLGYFKYTNFFISNFNALFKKDVTLLTIVLPIGISFFTFQLIAYLVDSYRGLTQKYSFLDYLLFISFFPQLIVGPIVHHSEMVPQFENEENWRVNWDNVAKGMFVFTIGVAKKVLIASPLTSDAQAFFSQTFINPVSPVSAWGYSIMYTISYYFDLSGYADMAIGIGFMFNIKIPENFNSPYKARNFQDYWQRWHITLSRFLGEYIFRSVYCKNLRYRNYYVATMITFLVSGFWHGAGWTFVLWGIINGVFVCIASWMKRKKLALPCVLAHFLTLLGIVLTRILFVSEDFSVATIVFKSLFSFSQMNFGADINAFLFSGPLCFIRLISACIIIFFMPTTHTLAQKFKPSLKNLIPLALAAGLAVAFMGGNGSAGDFLYFQF